MKNENAKNVKWVLNFVQDSYFERTSRPVYAIVFLLPCIVFYELGTILINTDLLRHYWKGRVVAFSWLQNFLENIGFSSKFGWVATPLAVVIILVALQMASRKRWRFWLGDILPMTFECIMLAVPLIVLGMFLNSSSRQPSDIGESAGSAMRIQTVEISTCSSVTNDNSPADADSVSRDGRWQELLANVVTGIGAGIYEELVFRLILIVALMMVFQNILQLEHRISIILSVLISAALFSAYHHIVYLEGRFLQSAPFSWPEFGFRTLAGVYFAVLFAMRGFGITAGVHIFYDIIAVFLNAFFPQS